jgi:hypothetical protein
MPDRQHKHRDLWLVAVGVCIPLGGGTPAGFWIAQKVSPSAGISLWPNPFIVVALIVLGLGIYIFLALIIGRWLPGGFTGGVSSDPSPGAPIRPAPVDVTLTPRQVADRLLLDVRNNGPGATFSSEVIFIFRSNGDGAPDTSPGWSVMWAADGMRGTSIAPQTIDRGQQRALDFAKCDAVAIRAARSGDTGGPHWIFPSLPEPVRVVYWPPIESGRDLSARRFAVTIRVYRSEPPGHVDFTRLVGISGSALVCEVPELTVRVLRADWKAHGLAGFIVAMEVEAKNESGKTIRLSPVHWMQTGSPGIQWPEPQDIKAIRSAIGVEQAQRTPSLYDRMEIADGETVRGWIVYGSGRSKTGGKPLLFLMLRDEEGNIYPAAVEAGN